MQKQIAEEARQKNVGLKWAANSTQAPASSSQPIKSLLEIQAEEEKELKKVFSIYSAKSYTFLIL